MLRHTVRLSRCLLQHQNPAASSTAWNNTIGLFEALTLHGDTNKINNYNLLTDGQRRFKKFGRAKRTHHAKYARRGTVPERHHEYDMADLERQTGGEYTHRPLSVRRLGGVNPETGEKNRHVKGGAKFDYLMVADHRGGPTQGFYAERVLEVRRDPTRKVYIALLAGSKGKRWVLATESMEADQIVRSTLEIVPKLISGTAGDAHPLGSLQPGTEICCVEQYPGKGSKFGIAPGSSLQVVRQLHEHTVVVAGNKHEYAMLKQCQAVIGHMSHSEWNKKWWGSPNMRRRFGWRHGHAMKIKKSGYHGRKIRPLPPLRIWSEETDRDTEAAKYEFQQWTLSRWQLNPKFGTHKVHPMLAKNTQRLWRNL